MESRLKTVQDQIATLQKEQEAAKEEIAKPFAQEDELREKSARLIELDTLLDIGKGSPEVMPEGGEPEAMEAAVPDAAQGTPGARRERSEAVRRSDSPGNAGEVRRINLMFWVTPHENELIRRRMAQAGTANLSAYLRKMAIDGLIVHLELPELKEMISLLRRCAGSLNQMAKRMNETGRVYEVDLRDAMELQERLWTMANALLTRLAGIR